ncbi:MAG: helix-turn-helix transcriptional regulator [Rhodomicrobiaceae bacterium]
MLNDPAVTRALEACYDAILMPESWPTALDALASSVGAVGCRFRGRSGQQAILELPTSPALLELVAELRQGEWWKSDHRAERGWPLSRAGKRVIIDHDVTTDEERRTLPIYNELLRRLDLPWWAAVGFSVDDKDWTLSFFRSESRGPFTPKEAEALAHLAPHLSRMVRLARSTNMRGTETALATLERIGRAALMVDANGRVIRTNAAAEALFDDELAVRQRGLVASDADSNREIQKLFAFIRAEDVLGGASPPQVIIRRRERRPLVMEALRLGTLATGTFGQTGTLLIITEIERRLIPPEDLLRQVFGLTSAEARLARRLAGGERIQGAAENLGITKNTARFQLKIIFAKTCTSRQSDLIAILGCLAR